MEINPKHKVPLLVVDGEPMTEARGSRSVAAPFRMPGLLPDDPWQELKADLAAFLVLVGIHPYLSRINAPPRVCDVPGADEERGTPPRGYLTEAFGIAEGMLDGREYFFDRFTAPDAHFFWCCRRATQFGFELGDFPNTAAHFERMQGRDSVRKLLAYEKQVMDAFGMAA